MLLFCVIQLWEENSMAMNGMPAITDLGNRGKVWTSDAFDTFRVKVYIPDDGNLPSDVINYGFEAPYLIVLEETERTTEEAAAWADVSGLAGIAAAAVIASNFTGFSVIFKDLRVE